MKLKNLITSVEKKLETDRSEEFTALLNELKQADQDLKDDEARDRLVEKIKEKNDHIEWITIKEI